MVLTLGGSDSSGGAGVQADLKVFRACGVHGACVVTALTAQDTCGVRRVHRVPPRFVAEQIDAVTRDLRVAAAKTGMLDRAQVVEMVAERVRRRRIPNLVVDPVVLAKDGTPLLNARGLRVLRERLLPLALVATPNLSEVEALTGVRITDGASLEAAAARLLETGVGAVVIKGGHREGPPVDTLFRQGERFEFGGDRVEGSPVHGTGCLYSAALTARIALGDSLPEACAAVKDYVARCIRDAVALGKGSRIALPPPWDGSGNE